jgi:hypothetical protein
MGVRDVPDEARWRKSSYSGPDNGDCLEVTADGAPGIVPVRDSKDVKRGTLVFDAAAWAGFVRGLRSGELR